MRLSSSASTRRQYREAPVMLTPFRCSCALAILGITPAKAVELAQDWNATCSPPWDLGDFQIKANSAFNSRLNPFGCAGSRYLLEPTTTAVHYPTKPISAKEAFQELRETPWFYDAAEFVSARQYKEELEEQYLKAERTKQYQQAIRAVQQFSVIIEDWWKMPILPAIDIPAVVHKEIHAKVGQRYPLVLTKAPKLQIRATAGLGKTSVVVEQVQRTDMRGKVIWILEPTHKKATEIAKEIFGATVISGRSSQNADGTAMCARQDFVHAVTKQACRCKRPLASIQRQIGRARILRPVRTKISTAI